MVLQDLADKLQAAGVKRLEQLVVLLGDGAGSLLDSVFPDAVGHDQEIVEYLDDFAKGLARKADFEQRIGRQASSGRLDDSVRAALEEAAASSRKRSAQEAAAGATDAEGGLSRKALKAQCSWGHRGGVSTLAAADEALSTKWAARALALLQAAGAPAYRQSLQAQDPAAAAKALLGNSRGATMRLRVRAWESFARWLAWRRGRSWPEGPLDLVDYVTERMADDPQVSFPRTFAAALGWFEARAGFPTDRCFFDNSQVRRLVESSRADAEAEGKETKKAPRFPVSLLMAMEVAVADARLLPRGLRVVVWARLIKAYGVLRTDDLQRIAPSRVSLGEAGFSAKLLRTKCSGPGKKVRELSVFIPVESTITGLDWLGAGYALWRESVWEGSDFFLPRLSSDGSFFVEKAASTGDLAGMFRSALLLLKVPVQGALGIVPGEDLMVPEMWALAWTGHSERASVTSLAAALGIPKEERDYLGRWSPKGSDEYVRTYRAVMKKTMRSILMASRCDSAFQTLDEAEAIETAMAALIRKGMDEAVVKAQSESLKDCAREVLRLAHSGPVEVHPSPGPPLAAAADLESTPDEQASENKEEREAKFVVSVARRRDRSKPVDCLHSRSGCWRGRSLAFANYELIFEDLPPAAAYNMVCRTCWPAGLPEGGAEAESGGSDGEGSSSSSS